MWAATISSVHWWQAQNHAINVCVFGHACSHVSGGDTGWYRTPTDTTSQDVGAHVWEVGAEAAQQRQRVAGRARHPRLDVTRCSHGLIPQRETEQGT
jgi:hypothetical protein